jgi:hypothetical protein
MQRTHLVASHDHKGVNCDCNSYALTIKGNQNGISHFAYTANTVCFFILFMLISISSMRNNNEYPRTDKNSSFYL